MKRIAIIGGGISGLTAAFALEEQRRAGMALAYVVFESSARLGGVLRTERVEGCLIEAGPDSFLSEKPWAADLCRQIGLGDQLIGSNDSQRKTYVLARGRLIPLPDGLMFMVPTRILPALLSPLFSTSTKLRMMREWFYQPHKADDDESVAALVERHYGAEMVDRLADPLLSGVYGGEASQLSVRAVLARFAEMEARYGSLGRGMMAARKKMAQGPARSLPAALFTSLRDGMEQLTDALVAHLPRSSLQVSYTVQSVQPQERGWLVASEAGTEHFDGVIVAIPASAAAELLRAASAELAAELRGISYSSSVTVTLGYGAEVRAALPPGFGFLVPRSEGKRTLAATFVHNKFPHRAPEDRALLRCFFGGTRDEPILQATEEQILNIVKTELRQIVGLNAEPLFARIYKWKGAMAQYAVGHLERLERIERSRQRLPGLALAGNAYRGIGVPDCARSGKEAAAQTLAGLGLTETLPHLVATSTTGVR
jgi:protoporphyrinogen/coproporphyrinogen III oxidase